MIFIELYCRTAVPLAVIWSVFLICYDAALLFDIRFKFMLVDRLSLRCPEVGLSSVSPSVVFMSSTLRPDLLIELRTATW